MFIRSTLSLFIAVVIAMLTSTAFAQDDRSSEQQLERYNNGVFVNPFWLLIGGISVGYERALGDKLSLMVSGVGQRLNVDTSEGELQTRAASLRVQPHYYFGKRGVMRGPYVAPFASAGMTSVALGTAEFSGVSFSGGATVGWSWQIRRFNLKLGIGGDYSSTLTAETDANGDIVESRDNGLGLAGDLKMGILF